MRYVSTVFHLVLCVAVQRSWTREALMRTGGPGAALVMRTAAMRAEVGSIIVLCRIRIVYSKLCTCVCANVCVFLSFNYINLNFFVEIKKKNQLAQILKFVHSVLGIL